ncbi:Hypothetical predicted protein [Octopus vulgaris]|uniref:JmjC domain-containing protein n=1 Tax=Octopus vulgaris TaxID=6645 RepID=A0AA36AUI2_OCTVU|nr:Hypothetical predicted protein [Octopus vulgaris]
MNCVGVQEHQASDIEIYHCPNCQKEHGPLTLKKRRNWHRHDYSETDSSKAVQTGTVTFIKELKNRNFPSADEIPILRVKGSDLTLSYFEENGFEVPILVENKEGLDIKVPPCDFSIQDIENHVGSMREIDVIDVARQEDYKMLMREWTEYYNSPDRDKIFNVISLEFSNTKLSELVVPPKIVRQVSWVNNMWPDNLPDDCTYSRPEVQKYCLMGVQDSFTDFHIDFGGTSVWYHVLRGEKVFYLIRPTPANMDLYESWISSSNQSETFFGDQVDNCYKSVVTAGQTLFIPTGWIHAVFTPVDTLVFGGNFLHSYNIPLQLKVYEIERHVKTPEKYLFPSFETICWYAAKYVLDILKDCEEDRRKASNYVIAGAKSLAQHLKSWTQRKDLNSQYIFAKSAKHDVPEHIQYGKLLKELVKVSRNFEVQTALKPKIERKKRKKNIPTPKQMESLDILHQHTTEKLQELQKQEHKNEEHKNVYAFSDDPPSPPPTSLKMRIPKAGAFIDNVLKTVKEEEENLNPVDISSLKLKVSNGRIVGDNVKPDVLNIGKFQPLMTDFDDDGDSDPDQLVVDESPTVRKKSKPGENNSHTTMKPGSLKLKLSFSGKYPNDNEGQLPLDVDVTPPIKRQRKTPAAKKEKKPAAPKSKSPGPKTSACKKEPKKAPARATKSKIKQTKVQDDNKNSLGYNLEEQGIEVADASKLSLNLQPKVMNTFKPDPLTIKVKADYSLQRAGNDSLLHLDQSTLSKEKTKDEPKGKKQKGEPKAKRGAAKKSKDEEVVNMNKEDSISKKVKNETNSKTTKDLSNKKNKSKEPDIMMEATKIEPLMLDTKYELPFLETRFEPLLEIKSDTPPKKAKGESKRGRGVTKKMKEELKSKGSSKKGKNDNLEVEVKENTSLDDFDNDQLVINLQDTKTPKRGKTDTTGKKTKSKAAPRKAKDNLKGNKGTPESIEIKKCSRLEETETKKSKIEPGKKSKNESAGNKSKIDPLFLNLRKDPQLEKSDQLQQNISSVTSNQTDSLKMAWSDLPLMTSPQHERKPLTSPQPDLQSLMAIRANLQSLTSSRSDSQSLTLTRQDHSSSKQNSPLKSPQSDPFSPLYKKSGPLLSLSASSSSSSSSSSLSSTLSSSKHSKSDPLSLTSTRPDPLSLIQKKTDSSPLTSPKKDSLSSASKKSETLFLLPKKPDPLSLVPKKPDPLSLIPPKKQDPLSLIPKKPDPLSLLPQKPDPLSLKITKSDSSLLSPQNPDSPSLKSCRPDALSLVTSHNNNSLSLLNNRPDSQSLLETKPDPLTEAFMNNKEPLTPKDKSILINSPKSEVSLIKKMSVDPLEQSCGKLAICEEVPNSKEISKSEEKKEEVSRTLVDIKVDQLASILKSESLLSKARLSTLKPLDIQAKDKEVDQPASSLPTTKHVEKLPVKEKVPSSPAGKLKQSTDLVAGNKTSANTMLDSTSKPETIISLKAELHAKQLAMQAKIAEEEGGNKKDLSVTETEQSKRMNMPTIRGGLNCGIADILEASGYGTETDFQVDEDVSAPSPTMRDAIQGMLSMSRMGSPQLFSGGAALGTGKGRKQWSGPQPDEEEQLGVCYKDDEYIYPSLDISDDEDPHIFKPRGKQKKDETWNPKARVQVSGEKRERVARDNARRESMESTLAATAAKYETIAKSKKGNRKRLKTEESPEDIQPSMSPGHSASHNLSPASTVSSTTTTTTTSTSTSTSTTTTTTVLPAVASTSAASDSSFSPANVTSMPPKGAVAPGTPSTIAVPGTSSGITSSNGGVIGSSGGSLQPRPFSSPLGYPSKPKKPKKGFATAKQRLGRILKIHKMRF